MDNGYTLCSSGFIWKKVIEYCVRVGVGFLFFLVGCCVGHRRRRHHHCWDYDIWYWLFWLALDNIILSLVPCLVLGACHKAWTLMLTDDKR